jgi:anti-sigma regulatory factor (Ser/Thr protein kinase)
MNRSTLGRFDILADADLQVAVLNIQSINQLNMSFCPADVAMIATVVSELGRNILKYGGARGYVLVTWIKDRDPREQRRRDQGGRSRSRVRRSRVGP